MPIGWVSLPLFDHNDALASGLYALRLWPEAEANPIGASMENVSVHGHETPSLYVQFEAFATPLFLPPLDTSCSTLHGPPDDEASSALPHPEVWKSLYSRYFHPMKALLRSCSTIVLC